MEDDLTIADDSDDAGGRAIGPYRLLDKIGEGGMGEVWLARQSEPVRRRVALKIIKPGMDSHAIVARFESERQALALMEHPSIARVLDGGETAEGRPYFVMEYIEGLPINEFADRNGLNTRQRLELFRHVCAGVQHAHQKAIIHRDLKPSNVLVQVIDDVATPKIIDFGVAKATAQPLTERTLFTQLGQMIGTPAYMSPEQAELRPEGVDTRTDVYSLGIVLYELLAGVLPLDPRQLRDAAYSELLRRIREEKPSKPSTRVSTLSPEDRESLVRRGADPVQLQSELRGDLDRIVMKAIDKDREQRYDTPSALAQDIDRYLLDEPVLATPPSAAYRARKFVRRHRLGVSGAAAVAVVLVGVAVWLGVLYRRAADAEAQAAEVVDFQNRMLQRIDPNEMGQRLDSDLADRVESAARLRGLSEQETSALLSDFESAMEGVNGVDIARGVIEQNILGPATGTLAEEFAGRPLIEAQLRITLGSVYESLDLNRNAQQQYERAWELRREELGAEHPETLRSIHGVAKMHAFLGAPDRAEELNREAFALARETFGERHQETLAFLSNLARSHAMQNELTEAEPLFRQLLEIHQADPDTPPRELWIVRYNLAHILASLERHEEAVEELAWARGAAVSVMGPLASIEAGRYLGQSYAALGRYDEATAELRAALAGMRELLGSENSLTLECMEVLARTTRSAGDLEESEALLREARHGWQLRFGDDHDRTLHAATELARTLRAAGRDDEAKSELSTALLAAPSLEGEALEEASLVLEELD